ncbi:MAG: iron ABC transporter substrate-binding protein [Microthrixaceae bacterium]|nr:iron ABC transporter substrate-binding protein [Microthrixaceae bacterium]MCO5319250.1 iron ABC transporter substrate-binding protein [Microthrixaceae bacterium]
MRNRTLAVLALLLLAASVSCSSSDEPGDGEEEGSSADALLLYTGRNMNLVGGLLEQFTADTGIPVDTREGGSAELAAQILTEGDATPADLFLAQDAGALGAVSKAGLFEVLPEDILEMVPEAYRAADGTWVGTSGRARVFVVNPQLVEDPPESIDDLLEPEWEGRIGFAPANASFQAFVTGLRVLRGDDAAREWLEGFAAQDPVAYENNTAVRDAVEAGEVEVGLVNHYYLYELIAEEGADEVVAENVYVGGGDPGGLLNVAGIGVLAATDHEDEALEFVRYLLGPEGQEYFAGETFEYPLVEGFDAAEGIPALESLDPPELDLSDLDSLAETQEMLSDTGLLTQ